jgi:cytochrome b
MAFLGRYAHQPMTAMMDMPMVDLLSLANATGKLIEEESEQTRRGTDID